MPALSFGHVNTSVTRGAHGLSVSIETDHLEQTSRAFKDIANEISRSIRDEIAGAAEDEVLPRAKVLAPGVSKIATTLVVRKGRRNTAYLTTTLRGKAGRWVGLLEFGGIVHTTIRPKRKGGAIRTPFGPRAAVSGPRHYRARMFMSKAAEQQLPEFCRNVESRLIRRFDRHLDRVL